MNNISITQYSINVSLTSISQPAEMISPKNGSAPQLLSSESDLHNLRLNILEWLIQCERIDATTLFLNKCTKRSISIKPKKLELHLKKKLNESLDIKGFIKEGHRELKAINSKTKTYISGSTVYDCINFFNYFRHQIADGIDLDHSDNKLLKWNLQQLAKSVVRVPHDFDLIDIVDTETGIITQKIESWLSKYPDLTFKTFVPKKQPLFPAHPSHTLFNMDTDNVKIDRFIGKADRYSIFFDLFISTKAIVNSDSQIKDVYVECLDGGNPNQVLFDYSFNILRLNLTHFDEFRAVLVALIHLSEGGFLLENIYIRPDQQIYCTLENIIYQHLKTTKENPEAVEIMLHMIKDRTEKHSIDCLSFYLNILIFFKHVSQENLPVIDRLWVNAKQELLKRLNKICHTNTLTTSIMELLKDDKITLDSLLHSLYDLALFSTGYQTTFRTISVERGKPHLLFKFDDSSLIFPINSHYFIYSNTPFLFEGVLNNASQFSQTIFPSNILAEFNQRLCFQSTLKELPASRNSLLFYFLLLFQNEHQYLSTDIQNLIFKITISENIKILLSRWVTFVKEEVSHLNIPLSFITSGYLPLGIVLLRMTDISLTGTLLCCTFILKNRSYLLNNFLILLKRKPKKYSQLFTELLNSEDLSLKDLYLFSQINMFRQNLTVPLLETFLQKYLLLSSPFATYLILSDLESCLPIFKEKSALPNNLEDLLLNEPDHSESHSLKVLLGQNRLKKIASSESLKGYQNLANKPFYKAILGQSNVLCEIIRKDFEEKIKMSSSLKDLSGAEDALSLFPTKTASDLFLKIVIQGLLQTKDENFQTWLINTVEKLFSLGLEQNASIQDLLIPKLEAHFDSSFFYKIKKILESRKKDLRHVSSTLFDLYLHYNVKSDLCLSKKFNFNVKESLKKLIAKYFRGLELNYYTPLTSIELTQVLKRVQEESSDPLLLSSCTPKLKRLLARINTLDKRIYIKEYLFPFFDSPAFFLKLLKISFELAPAEVDYLQPSILEIIETTPDLLENPLYKKEIVEENIKKQLLSGSLREIQILTENSLYKPIILHNYIQDLITALENRIQEASFLFDLMLIENILSKIAFKAKNLYLKLIEKSIQFKFSPSFSHWVLVIAKKVFELDLQGDSMVHKLLYPEIRQLFNPRFLVDIRQTLEQFSFKLDQASDHDTLILFLHYNVALPKPLNIPYSFNFESEHSFRISLSEYFRGLKLNYFAPLTKAELYKLLKHLQNYSRTIRKDFCNQRLKSILEKFSAADQQLCIEHCIKLFADVPEMFLSLLKPFSNIREPELTNFLKTLNFEKWSFPECVTLFEQVSEKYYPLLGEIFAQLSKRVYNHLNHSEELIKWVIRINLRDETSLSQIIDSLKISFPALLLPILSSSLKPVPKPIAKQLFPILQCLPWELETLKAFLDQLEEIQSLIGKEDLQGFFIKIIDALNLSADFTQEQVKVILKKCDCLDLSQKAPLIKALIKNHFTKAPEEISAYFDQLFSQINDKVDLKSCAELIYAHSQGSVPKQFTKTSLQFINEIADEVFWKSVDRYKDDLSKVADLKKFITDLLTFATIEKLPLIQEVLRKPLIQKKFSNDFKTFDLQLLDTLLNKRTAIEQLLPLLKAFKDKKRDLGATLQQHLDKIIEEKPSLPVFIELFSYLCFFKVKATEAAKQFIKTELDFKKIPSLSQFLPHYLTIHEKGWLPTNDDQVQNFHFELFKKAKIERLSDYFEKILNITKQLIEGMSNEEQLGFVSLSLKNLDIHLNKWPLFLNWALEFKDLDFIKLSDLFLDLYSLQFEKMASNDIVNLIIEFEKETRLRPITHQLLKVLIKQTDQVEKSTILNFITSLSFKDDHFLGPFYEEFPSDNPELIEQAFNTLDTYRQRLVYGITLFKKLNLELASKSFLSILIKRPEVFLENPDPALSFYKRVIKQFSKNSLINLLTFRQFIEYSSKDWVPSDLELLNLIANSDSFEMSIGLVTMLLKFDKGLYKEGICSFLKRDAHKFKNPTSVNKVCQLIIDFSKEDNSFSFSEYETFYIQLLMTECLGQAKTLLDLESAPPSDLKLFYEVLDLIKRSKTLLEIHILPPSSELKPILYNSAGLVTQAEGTVSTEPSEDLESVLKKCIDLYLPLYKVDRFKETKGFIIDSLMKTINVLFIHLIMEKPSYDYNKFLYQLLAFEIGSLDTIEQDPIVSYFSFRKKLSIDGKKDVDIVAENYFLTLLDASEKLYDKGTCKYSFLRLCNKLSTYLSQAIIVEKIDPNSYLKLLEEVTFYFLFLEEEFPVSFNQFKLLFTQIYTKCQTVPETKKNSLALSILYRSPFTINSLTDLTNLEGTLRISLSHIDIEDKNITNAYDIFPVLIKTFSINEVGLAIQGLAMQTNSPAITRMVLLLSDFFDDFLKCEEKWDSLVDLVGKSFQDFSIHSNHLQRIQDGWLQILTKLLLCPPLVKTDVFNVLFPHLNKYFTKYKESGLLFITKFLYNALIGKFIDLNRFKKEFSDLFEWGLELENIRLFHDPIVAYIEKAAVDYPDASQLLDQWIVRLIYSPIPRNYNLGIHYCNAMRRPQKPSQDFLNRLKSIANLKAQVLISHVENPKAEI